MTVAPPPPAAINSQNDIEDDDDDLPRPGKVWTASTGPSLSDLLKQQAATTVAESPAVEVRLGDLSNLWPQFMAHLRQQNSAMAGPLSLASLVAIEDNQAIIRFQMAGATFAEKWSTNGKKDAIAKALSEIRGSSLGVRFEVEETPAPAPIPETPAAQPVAPARSRPAASPAPAAPPPPARPSPELLQELQADPLVQTVLKEFGGTIIKVE
jgi:hypothetical protein